MAGTAFVDVKKDIEKDIERYEVVKGNDLVPVRSLWEGFKGLFSGGPVSKFVNQILVPGTSNFQATDSQTGQGWAFVHIRPEEVERQLRSGARVIQITGGGPRGDSCGSYTVSLVRPVPPAVVPVVGPGVARPPSRPIDVGSLRTFTKDTPGGVPRIAVRMTHSDSGLVSAPAPGALPCSRSWPGRESSAFRPAANKAALTKRGLSGLISGLSVGPGSS